MLYRIVKNISRILYIKHEKNDKNLNVDFMWDSKRFFCGKINNFICNLIMN